MATLFSFSLHPPNHHHTTTTISSISQNPSPIANNSTISKRQLLFKTISIGSVSSLLFLVHTPIQLSRAQSTPSSKTTSPLDIANTKSWFLFYGDGFCIRVPPEFEDIMEPEDFNSGLSLYGDKAKPKTFAARFASSNGSEVVSVIIKPTNQLKITFLEAKDIADMGSLKEAAKIFIPGGATLYSARIFKIKEEEGFRTYYYYEFSRDEQHVALTAAVNSGKAIIAGATAPQSKWADDGVKLRSAAISLTVL